MIDGDGCLVQTKHARRFHAFEMETLLEVRKDISTTLAAAIKEEELIVETTQRYPKPLFVKQISSCLQGAATAATSASNTLENPRLL